MWYCRRKMLALVSLCLGAGFIGGAYLSFWKGLVIGVVLIGICIYLCMRS